MDRAIQMLNQSDMVLLGFIYIVCLVLIIAFCIGAYEPWIEKESRKDAEKRLLADMQDE